MKTSFKKQFLVFIFLMVFSLFGYQAKAFSFLNFFEQVKNKLLNPQEEKIVKEIEAKKITLEKTIELIDKNSQEETDLFKKYCPLNTEQIKTSSSKEIFETIAANYLPASTSSGDLATSTEASSSKEIVSFKDLSPEIKEKILFDQKVCSGFLFSEKENEWYAGFKKELEQVKNIEEINSLIEKLKNHRQDLKQKRDSFSKISAILRSLENISLAQNRAEKISKDLEIIDLDEFSKKIIDKLFILARTKIKIASLETQKAKLLVLYLESFDDIWPDNNTSSTLSTTTQELSQDKEIKKQIALKIKLEKQEMIPSPLDLLSDSQEYLKSAYQDFSFISKLAQKE